MFHKYVVRTLHLVNGWDSVVNSPDGVENGDEELAFWSWFFDTISPLTNGIASIRKSVEQSP